MSSEDLWTGDEGGTSSGSTSDDPSDVESLDARVDELFTTAVERQVAEQRNLNRLLGELERSMGSIRTRLDELQRQIARDFAPSADRMGALDTAVRSLRESTAQQSVTLRAELQEAVAELREQRGERAQSATEGLETLRGETGALADALDAVANRLDTSLASLEARQGGLGEDLGRLSGRVDDLAATVDEAVQRGVQQIREQLREDRSPAEAVERLEVAVGELRRALHDELGAAVAPLGAALEASEARLSGRIEALERRQLDAQDAVEDAVAGPLAQLRADVAENETRTRAVLDDHAAREADRAEEQASRQARWFEEQSALLDVHAGREADRAEEQASRQARWFEEQSALLDEHRTAIDSALASSSEGLRAALDDQAAAARDGLDRLGSELAARVDGLTEQVARELATLRDERAAAAEAADARSDEQRAQMDALGERLRSIGVELTSELDRVEALGARFAQARALDVEAREELRAHLEAALDRSFAQGIARLETTDREAMQSLRATVGDQLDEIRGRVDAMIEEQSGLLGRALADHRASLTSLIGDLEATLEDRLDVQVGRVAGTVDRLDAHAADRDAAFRIAIDDVVQELRTATEAALENADVHVTDTVQQVRGRLLEVGEAVTEVRDHLADTQGDIGRQAAAVEELTQQLAALRGEVAETLAEGRQELRDAQAAGLAEVAAAVDDAERALEVSRVDLEETIGRLRSHGEAMEDRLGLAVDEAAADVRREAAGSVGELRAATERLGDMFDHLQHLERSLVDYMDSRDRRLERERVAVVRDLVDQLAGSLSKRQRKKLASELEVPDEPSIERRRPAPEPDGRTPAVARPLASATGAGPPRKVAVVRPQPASAGPVPAPPDDPAADDEPAAGATSVAELRRILTEVKGVGPAKQSRLIDELGSVDAVLGASAERIAEVRGFSPALAAAVYERLHAEG